MPNLVSLRIEDESILPRIVGFYEYHNALKLFDQLAAQSTEDEMKVYDAAIRKRPEFAIYVGQPSTALLGNDKLGTERVLFRRAFKQEGLSWVTALARVELGSMIAAFSNREDPFKEVAPTRFDNAEFNQLVAEGWESHWLGIQRLAKINEAQKGKLPPGKRGAAIVKIARRSKVASDMVVVSAGSLNPATSEGQYEQLQADYDQLQNYRDQLSSQLQAEMRRARNNVNTSTAWQTGQIPACARGGVERALAQGSFSAKTLK